MRMLFLCSSTLIDELDFECGRHASCGSFTASRLAAVSSGHQRVPTSLAGRFVVRAGWPSHSLCSVALFIPFNLWHRMCRGGASRSLNLLLGEVGHVLARDGKVLKSLELLSLDSLDLQALVLDSLSDLPSLLEVVKSILLLNLCVDANLVSKTNKTRLYESHG